MAPFRMQERDLDLLILEELHSDSGFNGWFAEQIGLRQFQFRDAEHSVYAISNGKWGETDVLAFFSDDESTVAVLIEDKIAADFAHRQAERYRERAADIVKICDAHRCITVLVAPSDYLTRVPEDDGWDHKLKLEDLRDWFASINNVHAKWRCSSLTECLSRVRRSASANNTDILRFSEAFADFLSVQVGGPFSHKKTSDKWGFIINTPSTKPHANFAWKTGKGSVDLTFDNHNFDKARHVMATSGVNLRMTSKSVIFSIDVPMVDLSAPFEEQVDVVADVMAAVRHLLPLVPLVLKGPGHAMAGPFT